MPLYLVATPIGNLEDITLRALRVLEEVAVVAAEDTRHTGRMLAHFGIKTPIVSYHEHNERESALDLVQRLMRGESVAVVTDAGTPGISDPAYHIVQSAIEAHVEVIPVPGATAAVAALIASGLPTEQFFCGGFLPSKRNARRERLSELRTLRATLVFYEAPHRIRATLLDAAEVLGNRVAVVARELTKVHEEMMRGTLTEIHDQFVTREPRGEMTLVIAPFAEDNLIVPLGGTLMAQIGALIATGLSRNEALKQAARSRGLSKKVAYRMLVEETNADDSDSRPDTDA